MLQCRVDYDFHCYGEVCNFVYCLFLKSKKVSRLSGIYDWEGYRSREEIECSKKEPIETFLVNYDFGKELLYGKTSEIDDFRVRCQKFITCFAVVLVESVGSTSGVSRGLYSFCPEILLEGDDSDVFRLYAGLCGLIEICGVISPDVSRNSVADFFSYVVERRGL